MKIARLLFGVLMVSVMAACAQEKEASEAPQVRVGAEQMEKYLPLLESKRVGICVNHTSRVGDTHLLDTLLRLGINVRKVFTPEHGLTGTADAGEHVADGQTDRYTIISLFGEKREPTDQDMTGLDVLVFDMQDVGVRFYTYISTMHYLMQAAARNGIPFVVLDRPNPNGSYVDGPILPEKYRSFVGIHPIPTVHGLTVGELAGMINGESWLGKGLRAPLTVVTVTGWQHHQPYSLPIKPSPNLPNDRSIALYPGLCLFEGTVVSVGRGTEAPFQHIGHPDYPERVYSFVPKPTEGAKQPKLEGQTCYGMDYRVSDVAYRFDIQPLISFYQKMGRPEGFFNDYFKLLSGDLDEQIKAGMTEEEIRATWQADLEAYKQMREKYLLYD